MVEGKTASTGRQALDESGLDARKLNFPGPLAQPPKCPECASQKLWKDGFRSTKHGDVQRWLCKVCGYRFSEGHSKKTLYIPSNKGFARQICVSQERKAKNLVKLEPLREGLAGATRDSKSLILEHAWQLKKHGLASSTIKQRVYRLNKLVEKGANLLDPETVTTILALSSWSDANKGVFIVAYKGFVKMHNLQWTPPKTRAQRILPFIPTESEIDQLIAGCGRKTAAFLQVLKDTAARGCEAAKLQWIDVDRKSNTIRINNPVKGSMARILKVKPKTISMINSLEKTSSFIFNPNIHTIRQGFMKQRRRIAKTLQNPRLQQIHFHSLRHWKATMEYHRTKDILHVKRMLGHKKLENTEIYTHLINFESDEWHTAHAQNLAEEDKLLEAGFEFVRYSEKDQVAIYRKRK